LRPRKFTGMNMIYVIAGTNRPNSRTRQVAAYVESEFKKHTKNVEVIDLAAMPFHELTGQHYSGETPTIFKNAIEKINNCDGLLIVSPEYNGSMPGALKYFIDFWSYPKSFEYRPVAFVGLGFRFGGLRPIEHLQQIFGYRNAFVFPERIFIMQISEALKDGKIVDPNVAMLLEKQAKGFIKFIEALKSQGLHCSQQTQSQK
jgi:chromate reductase, NAD(P)H dehydrogenase (quinone)